MWRHAKLVSLVLFRYPIMPNGDFGTVFVRGFADVRAFDVVRIRLVGLSLGGDGCRLVAHGSVLLIVGCLSANR